MHAWLTWLESMIFTQCCVTQCYINCPSTDNAISKIITVEPWVNLVKLLTSLVWQGKKIQTSYCQFIKQLPSQMPWGLQGSMQKAVLLPSYVTNLLRHTVNPRKHGMNVVRRSAFCFTKSTSGVLSPATRRFLPWQNLLQPFRVQKLHVAQRWAHEFYI